MSFIWAILGFIIAMGILVAIHEGGHFLVARLFKVKVLQFSLGFGKPFLKKKWGETEYCLAPFPLGGFVKMVDEREGPVAQEDLPRAFNQQSVYKRFAIVLAGPAVNLIFAWIAFTTVYFYGVTGVKPLFIPIETTGAVSTEFVHVLKTEPLSEKSLSQPWQIISISGHAVQTWQQTYQRLVSDLVANSSTIKVQVKPFAVQDAQSTIALQLPLTSLDINQPKQHWVSYLGFKAFQPKLPARVKAVLADSPAKGIGLRKGDLITQIDGVNITDWQTLVKVVQKSPGKKVKIAWLRHQTQMSHELTLGTKQVAEKTVGVIGLGVYIDPKRMAPYLSSVSYPLLTAVKKGWQHNIQLIDMTLVMLKRMLFGEVSAKNLSGPVRIAQYSGNAIQSGFVAFVSLLGLLSLSLGILNLLPIPVLDGGHLFFYIIEMLKGSPVHPSVEAVSQKIGLTLILGLTFFAIFNDLVRVTNG